MVRGSYIFKFSLAVLAVGVSLKVLRDSRAAFDLPTQSVEKYWSDTELGSSTLTDLILDNSCQSSEKYFLACANAVSTVAARYNLQIKTDGTMAAINAESGLVLSEKQSLSPWKELFKSDKSVIKKISFLNLWSELEAKYIPNEQKAMMLGTALNGFLSVFKDPHTYLMPIAYYKDVVSKSNNKSSSLGIILGHNGQNYFVRKIFAGAPAERAGLNKGDSLLAINGTLITQLSPARVFELMRGEPGQKVELTIVRNQQESKIKISREQTNIPTVTMRIIEGLKPVGVISINKFSRQTCENTKDALELLMKQSIRGLLLDLRDNPGGQMEEAACVASLFVGSQAKIFEIRYTAGDKEIESVYGTEDQVYKGPMAILINGGSASAAEIVAGSLHDLNRAALVGEKTFGKGSFQEGEVWDGNKNIAIFSTKGFYYLPSGKSPQMRGLVPDIPVVFKDNLQLREADQFISSLKAPESGVRKFAASKNISYRDCLDIEDFTTPMDDLEIVQARKALFCTGSAVVGGLND